MISLRKSEIVLIKHMYTLDTYTIRPEIVESGIVPQSTLYNAMSSMVENGVVENYNAIIYKKYGLSSEWKDIMNILNIEKMTLFNITNKIDVDVMNYFTELKEPTRLRGMPEELGVSIATLYRSIDRLLEEKVIFLYSFGKSTKLGGGMPRIFSIDNDWKDISLLASKAKENAEKFMENVREKRQH